MTNTQIGGSMSASTINRAVDTLNRIDLNREQYHARRHRKARIVAVSWYAALVAVAVLVIRWLV
jgi:hypothetical protein